MPQPAVVGGAYSTYIQDHESSGRLTVNFSRDPKKFTLNRYVQLQPAKRMAGYYRSVTIEEAARLVNADLADHAWADGQDAPEGWDAAESDLWLPYRTKRYQYADRIGDLAADQASYAIMDEKNARLAQKAMTARTLLAVTALTTTGNYPTGHFSAVSAISGNTGNWAASTTARQDIKRSLNHAANTIMKDTLAAVEPEDLILVMSPGCAAALAETQEIVDHIKGSPDALAQVRGELPGKNAIFGLPDKLYGFNVEIEKTVRVSSRKGATVSKGYVLPDATPFMVSRPGGLIGVAGAPTFSTCVVFLYENEQGADLKVESYHDQWNAVTKLRVVDNFAVNVVAGVSGFLFTSAV